MYDIYGKNVLLKRAVTNRLNMGLSQRLSNKQKSFRRTVSKEGRTDRGFFFDKKESIITDFLEKGSAVIRAS